MIRLQEENPGDRGWGAESEYLPGNTRMIRQSEENF